MAHDYEDVHDLDNTDFRLKMSDPVDFGRRWKSANNQRLWDNVRDLIQLRKRHAGLLRNEVEFFYVHPRFDENQGEAVCGYCRTGGRPLGEANQVVVVANVCGQSYPEFHLPWPWRNAGQLREVSPPTHRADVQLVDGGWARLSIAPFQARVFTT